MSARRGTGIGQPGGRSRMTARVGFTLVELIVALMVFVVGVLAVAGSSSLVMTMIGGAQRRTIAATVAEARFERLRGVPCTARANGSATTRGVREVWIVVPLVLADDVTVRTVFPSARGNVSTQTYRTYIPC